MFYSGIDQHKLDSVITTYNDSGVRLRQRRLRNDRTALVRYFSDFPGPHRAVVESTGAGTGSATCSLPKGSTCSWPTPRASMP